MPGNTTALTAYHIATWGDTTEDVLFAGGPNYEVWFSYTAKPGEICLGIWSKAPQASAYNPIFKMFTGPASAPVDFFAPLNANIPTYVGVTAGTTYYFRVRQAAVATPDSVLTFSLRQAPTGSIAAGTPFVPDVSLGFPAAAFNPTSGAIIRYLPINPGETGISLPTGEMMFDNSLTANNIVIYDTSLSVIGTVAVDLVGHGQISTDWVDKFYIGYGSGGNRFIKKTDNVGTVLHTWSLGAGTVRAGAPNAAGTIYYYTTAEGVAGAIKRWDLVNDVGLTDLVAAGADLLRRDMVVLADGTILMDYNGKAIRYNTSGTVLNTYTLANLDRIQRDPLDDTIFWSWQQTANTHTYSKIRISDGVVVSSFIKDVFIDGESQAVPADVMDRFGVSWSCPVVLNKKPLMLASSGGSSDIGSGPTGEGGDNSIPCTCCCPGEVHGTVGNPGDVIPPELPHDWEAICGFGGLAPNGNEPVNSEDYYVA